MQGTAVLWHCLAKFTCTYILYDTVARYAKNSYSMFLHSLANTVHSIPICYKIIISKQCQIIECEKTRIAEYEKHQFMGQNLVLLLMHLEVHNQLTSCLENCYQLAMYIFTYRVSFIYWVINYIPALATVIRWLLKPTTKCSILFRFFPRKSSDLGAGIPRSSF